MSYAHRSLAAFVLALVSFAPITAYCHDARPFIHPVVEVTIGHGHDHDHERERDRDRVRWERERREREWERHHRHWHPAHGWYR